VRTVSRVADLSSKLKDTAGTTGIAHTRWATHGAPVTENAHPIVSRGEVAVVHNGIIENHEALRAELQQQGYRFESQTDTEVIAHLVHSLYEDDLLEVGEVIAGALGPDADIDSLRGRSDALCEKRPLYPGFRGYTTYQA